MGIFDEWFLGLGLANKTKEFSTFFFSSTLC